MKLKNLLLFGLVFLFIASCGKKEEEVIKIGAILPLTGDVAVYGNNTKEGIDLAVEEINKNGGVNGKKIRILYEDSKAEPRTGVTVFQNLISQHSVQVIIDNSVSSVALALVPIAEKNSVVILSTGSTNPQLSGISPLFFRIWNSDDLEGKLSAKFIFDSLKIVTSSIVYVNNDYGKGLEAVYKKMFNSLGGKIISSESFEQNTVNFRTTLTKIKKDNPQAIYLVGYSKEVGNLLKQVKELNIRSQIIGTVTMQDPQVISIAGSSANNAIYPYPFEPNKNDSSVAHFYNAFKNKYKKEPGITADVGYDAVYLIALAVKLSDYKSGAGIKDGLRKIKEYEGASGIIEFDKNGDVNKPMIVKKIENGKFINYY